MMVQFIKRPVHEMKISFSRWDNTTRKFLKKRKCIIISTKCYDYGFHKNKTIHQFAIMSSKKAVAACVNVGRKRHQNQQKVLKPLIVFQKIAMMACFNVGGKRYEVSRYLLEKHPDSMLARRFSEQLHKAGPDDAEIFIERNGERFQYVLDYLRDGGRVFLPQTETKGALLADLEYYGIPFTDNDKIAYDHSCMDQAQKEMQVNFQDWEIDIDGCKIDIQESDNKLAGIALAKDCLSSYYAARELLFVVNYDNGSNQVFANLVESYFNQLISAENREKRIVWCNVYLHTLGLKVLAISWERFLFHDYNNSENERPIKVQMGFVTDQDSCIQNPNTN